MSNLELQCRRALIALAIQYPDISKPKRAFPVLFKNGELVKDAQIEYISNQDLLLDRINQLVFDVYQNVVEVDLRNKHPDMSNARCAAVAASAALELTGTTRSGVLCLKTAPLLRNAIPEVNIAFFNIGSVRQEVALRWVKHQILIVENGEEKLMVDPCLQQVISGLNPDEYFANDAVQKYFQVRNKEDLTGGLVAFRQEGGVFLPKNDLTIVKEMKDAVSRGEVKNENGKEALEIVKKVGHEVAALCNEDKRVRNILLYNVMENLIGFVEQTKVVLPSSIVTEAAATGLDRRPTQKAVKGS